MDTDIIAVAALDIGTTYSGYAFSFRNTPDSIYVNKSWSHELGLGFPSYKLPTSILTKPNGEFETMGFEAELNYIEDQEEDRDSLLFRHFKMMLHKSEEVNQSTTVPSVNGAADLAAVTVFAYAIAFLKDHLLEAISNQTGSAPNNSNIMWVITVPAIWSEQSKKFMRDAAKKAGCIEESNAKNILLALEPEAASLCCRRQNVAVFDNMPPLAFPEGTKYLVLDCGGGTVDVTAHKTTAENKVEEILHASGGALGGIYVDERFIQLIEAIFGKEFIDRFKREQPHPWLTLLTSFETVKKQFQMKENAKLRISLPYPFLQFVNENHEGGNIGKIIKDYSDENVQFKSGYLLIQSQSAAGIFQPIIEQIVDHVRALLGKPEMADCNYIFMVGGFSECRMLQDAVRKEFESEILRVLIPNEAQLAIIRGAILFGHNPEEIETRVARKTYGIKQSRPFVVGRHREDKKWTNADDKILCKDIFRVLVEKDHVIKAGEEFSHTSFPESSDQEYITKEIYTLNGKAKKPVQYTDDDNCEHIGTLTIPIPKSDRLAANEIRVVMKFGGTEMTVHCVHVPTGQEVSANFDLIQG